MNNFLITREEFHDGVFDLCISKYYIMTKNRKKIRNFTKIRKI